MFFIYPSSPTPLKHTHSLFHWKRRQLAPVLFNMCFGCSTSLTELFSLSRSVGSWSSPTYWSGKRGMERWERKQLRLSAMFVATFWFYGNGFSEGLILLSCYQLVHFNFLLLEYIHSVLATWYKFLCLLCGGEKVWSLLPSLIWTIYKI